MSRRSRRGRLVAAASLLAGVATAFAPLVPATAAGPDAAHRRSPEGVVATGLENPRQLTVGPLGAVYVAEAGRGGSGACIPNPEGGEACLGATGAVTRILWGTQKRVVTGLPSLAGPGGGSAQGPADVEVHGLQISIVLGLGGSPAARDSLGTAGEKLGTVVAGRIGGRLKVVADPVALEARENPAGEDLDANPSGLLRHRGRYVVADAGANVVASFKGRRDSVIAVPESRMVDAPPFLGLPPGAQVPMQSVPTDVVVGPDGAYYISELTGFPFPKGASRILRVVPGRQPTVYATGLTTVTSLAWRGRDLYAVQLTDDGLLTSSPGSLRKVTKGGSEHPVVAGGLFMPYGVAISGRTAYVTNCSVAAGPIPDVCPRGGEVRAIPLR